MSVSLPKEKKLQPVRTGEVDTVKALLDRLNPVEVKVLNETLHGVALLFEKAITTS